MDLKLELTTQNPFSVHVSRLENNLRKFCERGERKVQAQSTLCSAILKIIQSIKIICDFIAHTAKPCGTILSPRVIFYI